MFLQDVGVNTYVRVETRQDKHAETRQFSARVLNIYLDFVEFGFQKSDEIHYRWHVNATELFFLKIRLLRFIFRLF